MHLSRMHFPPVALPFLAGLLVLLGIVVVLVQIGILSYAYERIGVQRRHVFGVLLLSLLGSYVNVPVAQLPPERVLSNQVVDFFGMRYVIPEVQQWPGTVVAVNVGGAVIPTVLSLYLLSRKKLWARGLVGAAVVATVAYSVAQPVRGVGIVVPVFVPPLVAAAVALLLARKAAPALAYAAGSLGTLVGADLLNLGRIQGLGAPVASIGGAGTFDGIFMTGILAVLLA